MSEEMKVKDVEENVEELSLDDLEQVAGGGMGKVVIEETIDISQEMKDRA